MIKILHRINTKKELVNTQKTYGVEVDIVDPIADEKKVKKEFDINLLKNPELGNYSGKKVLDWLFRFRFSLV